MTRAPAHPGPRPAADAALADSREAIRAFVLNRNPGLDPATLRDDTPLLGDRLVTSLHLVDLLLLLESLRRAPVDVRRMRPESFRCIDAIVGSFLDTEPGHDD